MRAIRIRCAVLAGALMSALFAAAPLFSQAGVWTTKAPMPVELSQAAPGVVGGKLYVAGGWDCSSGPYKGSFRYDPGTDKWEARGQMPSPQVGAASAVVNGILYVIGGYDAGLPLSVVAAYDPKTDAWSARAPMPTARFGSVAGVIDGIIYVAGGLGGPGVQDLTTLEAYDQRSDTWKVKAPMPTARYYAAGGVINGILYVAGGNVGGPGEVFPRVLEAYDPKTNTWSAKTPMPEWMASVGSAVLAGKLYVTNGAVQFGTPLPLQVYDPSTDSWSVDPPMPTGRNWPAASVAQDVLYVVGGQSYVNGKQACLAVNEAFSPFEMVSIDIKPGDASNTINLGSRGVVPVAILGSATFDPMTVDPATVVLTAATDNGSGAPGGAHVAIRGRGALMTGQSDVNGDGYPDLVLYFRTQDLTTLQQAVAAMSSSPETPGGQRPPLQIEAVLYGTTYSGQRIRGSDTVRIVPAGKGSSAGTAGNPAGPAGRGPALQTGARGEGVSSSAATGSGTKTLPTGPRGGN
jgi:N-acetylneuraminic acid mutarotase